MRLGTIFYFYRVRLRARLVQELLAVAGIAVGVALLFASQVANTSLTGSATQLTNGIVGSARLQMTGRDPHGFSERLLDRVQALPDVRVAVPILQRSVSVRLDRTASVDLVGITPGFARLQSEVISHLRATQLPAQQGVALPASTAGAIGAHPLQRIVLQVGDHSNRVLVSVVLQKSDVGELINSEIAIAPLGLAQRLAGMDGRVNRLLVTPATGHEKQVEAELRRIAGGRLNVVPANFEAAVFRQAEGPMAQSTQMFSAISALVGFLFAFNAMLLTVPQRRSLIADLRLDGYAPGEIVKIMLFDVLVLATVGVLAGLALGDLLSHSLLQAEPGYLSLAFPLASQHIVTWQSVAIATVGGVLAAAVGVLIPLRHEIFGHGSRKPPDLRASTSRNRFLVMAVGAVCLAFTTSIVVVGVANVFEAVLAFVSLTLALLLIVPTAFRLVVYLIDRLQRPIAGVSPRLAVIELMSGTTKPRSLAIAATGAIAVFGSVAIGGARQNLEKGLYRVAGEVAGVSDIWVVPSGRSNTLPTTPFADVYLSGLRRLPGVAAVSAYRGAFLDIGDRRALVMAPPRSGHLLVPPNQVVAGDLATATMAMRGHGWATLSQALASELGVTVGHRFTLPTPVPSSFRLAAITSNFGWSPGAVILNADDYARAWGSGDVSAYELTTDRNVATATVRGEVARSLAQTPSLSAETGYERERLYRAVQHQGLARLSEIAVLVLTAAALAMAAAMGAMIWQRRSRIAGMKVDGFSQGELWRALLWESALLLGAGCLIGALFGLYGQLLLSKALVGVAGFPVVFGVGLVTAVGVLALVTAVAVAIAALPGYVATQVRPALQD